MPDFCDGVVTHTEHVSHAYFARGCTVEYTLGGYSIGARLRNNLLTVKQQGQFGGGGGASKLLGQEIALFGERYANPT